MTPIRISEYVKNLDDDRLRNKLNYLSYIFCVNADFSKTEATNKLVADLEMHVMEGILRVLNEETGNRPYQNKIYEYVEMVFEDQDSYNINRMMSSIRRSKIIPISAENKKYMNWMKNRIRYGIKSIMEHLEVFSDVHDFKEFH